MFQFVSSITNFDVPEVVEAPGGGIARRVTGIDEVIVTTNTAMVY